MKASELRSKTIAELKKSLLDLRKESFNLRLQKSSGQLESVARSRIVRKNIARIKTIISEQIKTDTLRSEK